jgi:hypothetical protein
MANTFDKIDEDQNNYEKVLEIILHVGSLANISSARQLADRFRFLFHVSKEEYPGLFR